VTAVRVAPWVWKVQITQPLLASSAKTRLPWLPTNTRPPATVGWDQACEVSGKPIAHFSLSFGTSAAVMPAMAAGWKRLLA